MATFGKKKVDKSKTVTEQQSDGSVLYFYYDKNSNYLGYSPETFDNLPTAGGAVNLPEDITPKQVTEVVDSSGAEVQTTPVAAPTGSYNTDTSDFNNVLRLSASKLNLDPEFITPNFIVEFLNDPKIWQDTAKLTLAQRNTLADIYDNGKGDALVFSNNLAEYKQITGDQADTQQNMQAAQDALASGDLETAMYLIQNISGKEKVKTVVDINPETGQVERDAYGVPITKDFKGHFDQGLTAIMSGTASYAEIYKFQTYLEQNNIVPKDYFLSSQGEYSPDLVSTIQQITDYIDTYYYVVPGTEEYKEVQGYDDVVFFSDQDMTSEKAQMDRKLFNWGLQKFAEDTKLIEKATQEKQDEAIMQQLFERATQEYPDDEALIELMTDSAAEAIGRQLTEKELDNLSVSFGKKYSAQMMDAFNASKEFDIKNIFADYLEGTNIKRSDVEMGGYMPTERRLDADMFKAYKSPSEIVQEDIETKYTTEASAYEQGLEKIKQQKAVLPYLLRNLNG